jgi:hypothetical protein
MNKKRKNNPPAVPNSNGQITQVTQHQFSAGPIPPPDILQRYDQVIAYVVGDLSPTPINDTTTPASATIVYHYDSDKIPEKYLSIH